MILKVGKGKLSPLVSAVLRGGGSPFLWCFPCGNGHTSGTSSSKMATLFCPLFMELSRSIYKPALIHWAFPPDLLPSRGKGRNSCLANLQTVKELERFLPCWCSVLPNLCRRRALGLKISIQAVTVRRLVQGITSHWGAISCNRFLREGVCGAQD